MVLIERWEVEVKDCDIQIVDLKELASLSNGLNIFLPFICLVLFGLSSFPFDMIAIRRTLETAAFLASDLPRTFLCTSHSTLLLCGLNFVSYKEVLMQVFSLSDIYFLNYQNNISLNTWERRKEGFIFPYKSRNWSVLSSALLEAMSKVRADVLRYPR